MLKSKNKRPFHKKGLSFLRIFGRYFLSRFTLCGSASSGILSRPGKAHSLYLTTYIQNG